MARRICILLLMASASSLGGCAMFSRERPVETTPVEEPGRVIQPQVVRPEIKPADIDSENFEVGGFVGIMSVEDFGANPVYGLRAAYHITEGLFVEGAAGITEAGLSSIEELANVRVTEDRDYTYYNLSVGYNLMPGEIFLGRERAFNSAFYLIAGIGSTSFAEDDRFTVNFGAGLRVLATDWLAVHIDARAHRFATDLLGKNKAVYNLEGHVGFTFFF
jgi:outer membrane beta-barrel protein